MLTLYVRFEVDSVCLSRGRIPPSFGISEVIESRQ